MHFVSIDYSTYTSFYLLAASPRRNVTIRKHNRYCFTVRKHFQWRVNCDAGIDVAAKFHEYKIVPDLLNEPPTKLCTVSKKTRAIINRIFINSFFQIIYNNVTILPGDDVPRNLTENQPEVIFQSDSPKTLHTLYMIGMHIV